MRGIFLLCVLIAGCSPRVQVNQFDQADLYEMVQRHESFALIEGSTNEPEGMIELGEIEVRDIGLSINCDYESVKRIATERAREMGGNCLIITDHIKPGDKSSCHRIKGKICRIDDPEQYENLIIWHADRRLKIENFKGSIEKRPHQAVTYTTMNYYSTVSPITGKATVVVENLFDCGMSYFKRSDRDSAVLAHEQLHFDIAEIYTRKFRKVIIEDLGSYKQFSDRHEEVFAEIMKEMRLRQDEYDAEVYPDDSLQVKWQFWVEQELAKLDQYTSYHFEL